MFQRTHYHPEASVKTQYTGSPEEGVSSSAHRGLGELPRGGLHWSRVLKDDEKVADWGAKLSGGREGGEGVPSNGDHMGAWNKHHEIPSLYFWTSKTATSQSKFSPVSNSSWTLLTKKSSNSITLVIPIALLKSLYCHILCLNFRLLLKDLMTCFHISLSSLLLTQLPSKTSNDSTPLPTGG